MTKKKDPTPPVPEVRLIGAVRRCNRATERHDVAHDARERASVAIDRAEADMKCCLSPDHYDSQVWAEFDSSGYLRLIEGSSMVELSVEENAALQVFQQANTPLRKSRRVK